MATVLPTSIGDTGNLRRSSSGAGLRRSSSSSHSMNLLATAANPPASSRRPRRKESSENKRPSKPKSSLKKSASFAIGDDIAPYPIKNEQSAVQSQPRSWTNKTPLSLHTVDLPPPLAVDEEEIQAPPSSPSSSSPPTTVSPLDTSAAQSPPILHRFEDDMAVKNRPTEQVDYLSYDWAMDEVSASWRHIVTNRGVYGRNRGTYGQVSRLENAAWRAWWKQKNSLSSLPPEHLNWMKENDTTWLYGPKQNTVIIPQYEEVQLRVSYSTSTLSSPLSKRPILKRRTPSQAILQSLLSNSSLIRQAATAVQAQQARPSVPERRASDFAPNTYVRQIRPFQEFQEYFSSSSTSGLQTPSELGERKHISFSEKVEQCVAVDIKDANADTTESQPSYNYFDDDMPADDEVLVMRRSHSSKPRRPALRKRRSSSVKPPMIEKMEPTTLNDGKRAKDSHESVSHSLSRSHSWNSSRLSPSPSVETLRPPDPSRNFLIHSNSDEELQDALNAANFDDFSEPFTLDQHDHSREEELLQNAHEEAQLERGMRRTASGMLMPAEDSPDSAQMNGVFGAIIDGMNTARDIATVVWNVGWKR